ncbi:MAG: DUF2269 family protein [Draconibacterium sp.]
MIKKLDTKEQKLLKFFHLLFAFMWFGGGLALTLFALCFVPTNLQEAHFLSNILDFIDVWFIIIGANGLLVTGLIYGIWTKWGFFKHTWITIKWIILAFQIVFGTFVLGYWVSANLEMAESMKNDIQFYPDFFKNLQYLGWGGSLQMILLIAVILISVYKPWKKR